MALHPTKGIKNRHKTFGLQRGEDSLLVLTFIKNQQTTRIVGIVPGRQGGVDGTNHFLRELLS